MEEFASFVRMFAISWREIPCQQAVEQASSSKEVSLTEIMFSSGISRQLPENKWISSALCPQNQKH